MKTKHFIFLAGIVIAAACNSGNDTANANDTANTLNDTFPALRPGDSVALDSNPPDATHIDSLNNSTR